MIKEEKISVEQFVMGVHGKDAEKLNEYIESHVITQYVPVLDKIGDCERIVKSTYFQNIPTTEEKELYINSVNTYLLFTMLVISRYTDIEIHFNDIAKEYDMLNQKEMIAGIFHSIPKAELDEYDMFLKMKQNDTMQNEYEIKSYITKRLNNLSLSLEKIKEPVLEMLVTVLENVDEDKVNSIFNKVQDSKFFKKIIK